MAKTLKKSMKKPHRKISRQKRRTQKRGGEQVGLAELKAEMKSFYIYTARILNRVAGAIARNKIEIAQSDEYKLKLLSSFKLAEDTINLIEKGTTPDIKLVQKQTLELLEY